MKSEELELSLRTEFEDFLKQISADTQREISALQEKVEAEFERQRTQFAEMFRDFSASAAVGEKQLDAGFRDSILEHLRQSRDEGARITAIAMAEAEDLAKETAAAAAAVSAPSFAGVAELRDAIKDISKQNSQAAILQSLVSHAEKFTVRGAFFIVKNEHFVGWRTLGSEREASNEAVRDIFFSVSDATTLGESVASLDTVESAYGNYEGDDAFLEKLEFGKPDKMLAIPLVARGRGVAVLYADGGAAEAATDEASAGDSAKYNVEALEMLVRVAGLTVELLAAATSSPSAANTDEAVAAEAPYSDESEAVRNEETVTEQTEFGEQIDSEAVQLQQEETGAQSLDKERFDDSQMPVYADTPASDVEIFGEEAAPAEPSLISSGDEEEMPAIAADEFQQPAENYDYSTRDDSQGESVETSSDDFAFDGDEREKTPSVSAEDEFEPIYQDGQIDSAESYSWNQPSENGAQAAETLEAKDAQIYETGEAPQDEFPTSTGATVLDDELSLENERAFETPQNDFAETPASFDTIQSVEEAPQFESADFETSTPNFLSDENENLGLFEKPAAENFAFEPIEKTVEPATVTTTGAPSAMQSTRSRFSDRNVDLPIEVTEDERRLHNDARRFARLLVSEIKLYNELKVKEGREANDLYERLREAVDRSREMYDKRVQPPVAAKFDYFHYELVSSLAEGDESKLGATYAGATV